MEPMKATIEFTLPEDTAEFMSAVHSGTTKDDIEDLRDQVRSRLKHGPEPDREFVEEIYKQLLEITPYL